MAFHSRKGFKVLNPVIILSVLILSMMLLSLYSTAQDGYTGDQLAAGWNTGTFTNMTTAGDNLTLAANTTGDYNTGGGWISSIIDISEVVEWGIINWSSEVNASNHTLTFRTRYSNNSVDWGSWSSGLSQEEDIDETSRYLQYMINATTNDIGSTPKVFLTNISYYFVKPIVTLDSPDNNEEVNASDDIGFDCTAISPNILSTIELYWNYSGNWESNGSAILTGEINSTYFARGNLSNGTYLWNCFATDSAGHSSWASSNRTLIVSLIMTTPPPTDHQAPVITHTINKRLPVNGTEVAVHVGVTDNVNISHVWMVTDYPGGSEMVWLNKSIDHVFNVTRLGRHNITIFANDTSGNLTNTTDYFTVYEGISIDINVSDNDGTGIDSSVMLFDEGTTYKVSAFSSSSGDFTNNMVPNTTLDLRFSAFDDEFIVLIGNVDMWSNTDRFFGMDDPNAASGFESTYAVNTNYAFSDAVVRIYYDEDDVDEDTLEIYICDDWNFTTRLCNTTWNVTESDVNKSGDYVEAEVSGFSAFSLKQESYCGDGTCDDDEDSSSCSEDCVCDDGDTRLCSLHFKGLCAIGSESCSGGAWSGCPNPGTEICNQRDDDCDGINDNVGGGNSIESTRCGCYNGSLPTIESFDGVDNDCNQFIDDGCLCIEGETDVCHNNVGACVQGIKTCINCRWSECEGKIGPFDEVCGNGVDDDCDGETDEVTDCIPATNVTCGYGAIPATGCKCGEGTYASGYCCNGVYKIEPCPEFPWWILIIVGGVVLAVIVVYYILHGKANKGKDEWEALEKKYTPARL